MQGLRQYVQAKIRRYFNMSIIGTIYEDVTTDVLGDIGSWQWLVTMVSTILMTNSFFRHYEDIFLLYPTGVMCIPSTDHEDILNETLCSYKLSNGTEIFCVQWHLQLLWVFWIKKSWLLFCDDNMKLLLTAVIFRLAAIFGYVIFGLVADSFGRKVALIVDVFSVLFLRTAATFCDSEAWFRLILFLEALFGTATMFMGLVIVSEIASIGWRSWLNVIVMIPRLMALVSTVQIANAAGNPETYNLIGCFFGLVYIFVLRWVPESPQWMLYNRKIHLAENLLTKAATKNNINISAEFKIRPVNQRAYFCLDETMTCFKLLSVHNVRIVVAITLSFWGIFNFIWSFLHLKIYSESNGSYMCLKATCFLVGMAVVTVILSNVLSLQRFLIINIVFTAIVTAGAVIVSQQLVREFLSAIALASGLMVHALILNITPRYYAINIRATLFGCCQASGQFGAMIGYILFIYKAMDDITFVAVELGLSVVLVILSFALPHVGGRELPDVMEDMEYFTELSKPLRWATQKRRSASKEEIEMRKYSFGSSSSASAGQSTMTNQRVFQANGPWQKLIALIQRRFKSKTPTQNAGHRVEDSPKDHTYSQVTHISTITHLSQEDITNTSTVVSINDDSYNFHYTRFSKEYFNKTKFSNLT